MGCPLSRPREVIPPPAYTPTPVFPANSQEEEDIAHLRAVLKAARIGARPPDYPPTVVPDPSAFPAHFFAGCPASPQGYYNVYPMPSPRPERKKLPSGEHRLRLKCARCGRNVKVPASRAEEGWEGAVARGLVGWWCSRCEGGIDRRSEKIWREGDGRTRNRGEGEDDDGWLKDWPEMQEVATREKSRGGREEPEWIREVRRQKAERQGERKAREERIEKREKKEKAKRQASVNRGRSVRREASVKRWNMERERSLSRKSRESKNIAIIPHVID